MGKLFRYFKSNIISGCRLADIDKYVTKDEVFYLNAHIAATSRSVAAAARNKWILEITEKEASQHITIPDISVVGVHKQEIKLEAVKENTANTEINEAALKRQQEYLKKIEAKSKANEAVQEEDEELNIEPGKNDKVNLAALDRIKKFQKKRSGIETTKQAYLQEFADLDKHSANVKNAIEKQIRKTPEQRNQDLLINKKAETKAIVKETVAANEVSKNAVKNEIDKKLEEKKQAKIEKVEAKKEVAKKKLKIATKTEVKKELEKVVIDEPTAKEETVKKPRKRRTKKIETEVKTDTSTEVKQKKDTTVKTKKEKPSLPFKRATTESLTEKEKNIETEIEVKPKKKRTRKVKTGEN